MKTDVKMIRMMGDFEVMQRIKDSMFNCTKLLEQYKKKHRVSKDVSDYFVLKSTKELINTIMEEENLNTHDSVYLKSKGKYGGTWLNPMLFIDFAMWLNPKFKYHVLKFVSDELVKNRHLAGDNYKKLSSSLARLKGVVKYQDVAKALNHIVFGKHESGIRNTASDEQLRDLQELESSLSLMIDARLVQTFDQLLEAMRGIWALRHPVCAF